MAKDGFWLEGGRLALDFIETNGSRSGELLSVAPDLSAWLAAAGLTGVSSEVSAAQFERAHVLRAALGRLIRAGMGEGRAQPADVDIANAAAAEELPRRLLSV